MEETTIEEKLRILCERLEFEKMSSDTIQMMERFPLDFPVTPDFILGTQTYAASALILLTSQDDVKMLQTLAMSFLYRWWKTNFKNEFTEAELII